MSTLLQEKIVEAHDQLWKKMLLANEPPASVSTLFNMLEFVNFKELANLRQKPELQHEMTDTSISEWLKAVSLNEQKIYVDEVLWRMAQAKTSFVGRIILMLSVQPAGDIEKWQIDELLLSHLRNAFTMEELVDKFSTTRPSAIRDIIREWDDKIVHAIRDALESL